MCVDGFVGFFCLGLWSFFHSLEIPSRKIQSAILFPFKSQTFNKLLSSPSFLKFCFYFKVIENPVSVYMYENGADNCNCW